MPQKRLALWDDDDPAHDEEERSHKQIKAETKEGHLKAQDASFPTAILSGFTWTLDVDARIARVVDPYGPVFMEVSLELPAEEKLGIKYKYDIQTDFVKIVLGGWEDRDRLVQDLDHARFTWTMPYLQAWKVEGTGGESGSDKDIQQPAQHNVPKHVPTTTPEQDRRVAQARVWIKLSEAITDARAHLFGDDLDTFEALIARPEPGFNPMERVDRWIRGGITMPEPQPQPQKMNMGVPRVKAEEVMDYAVTNKKDVTMDDEMAEMGFTFGRTDMTPWW